MCCALIVCDADNSQFDAGFLISHSRCALTALHLVAGQETFLLLLSREPVLLQWLLEAECLLRGSHGSCLPTEHRENNRSSTS